MSEYFDELEEGKAAHDSESASNEKDASGKGEYSAKPTGKKAKNQGKADKNGSAGELSTRDSVATSEVPGMGGSERGGVKEAVAEMFDGQDLSEDFRSRAETIFEAALNERAYAILEQLQEEYEQRLEEELEGAVNELVERLDDYLDYAVSHYMEENALAIEAGVQVEMAESFMEGLKTLYMEHNVEIDEEKIDIVSEMNEQIEALEEKLNEVTEENIQLHEAAKEAAAATAFAEVAEGLTMSEAERFAVLTEGVDFSDTEAYRTKLEVIKENYFGSKRVLSESHDEEPIDIAEERYVDPGIAAVAAAISKNKR